MCLVPMAMLFQTKATNALRFSKILNISHDHNGIAVDMKLFVLFCFVIILTPHAIAKMKVDVLCTIGPSGTLHRMMRNEKCDQI